jgi:hypothetical protein
VTDAVLTWDGLVTVAEADALGRSRRTGLGERIRPYMKGRDLQDGWEGLYVIDLYGMSSDEVRRDFAEAYQHLVQAVKAEREAVP